MERKLVLAGILLALVYLVLSLSTITEAGLVWDETRYLASAKARAYSIFSALTGKPQMEICSLDNPPQDPDNIGRCWDGRPRLSQTVSGVVWAGLFFLNGMQFDFWSSVIAHRITTVLYAAFAVFLVFIFASKAFNTRVGIFSSLALIFMPHFFAHSQYSTLDVPVATMTVLSFFVLWLGLRRRRYALLFGPVFGLALATKTNAYLLIPSVILWIILSYRDKLKGIPSMLRPSGFLKRPVSVLILSFLILTPIFMLVSWPWLWKDPLGRYMDYLDMNARNREHFGVDSCYFGSLPSEPPWHYPLVFLAFTTPTIIILLSVIGIAAALWDTRKLSNRNSFLFLSAALIPFLTFTLPLVAPYNGVRLFMNFLPFIAVLAGMGADRILKGLLKAPEDSRFNKAIAIVMALAIAIPGLYTILSPDTSPAQYFNWLAGGTKGAFSMGLQVEYYGASYLDAALWLNQNAKQDAKVHVPLASNIFETYKYGDIGLITQRAEEGRQFLSDAGIGFGDSIFQQDGLLRKDIQLAENVSDTDYVVVMVRSKCEGEYNSVSLPYYQKCTPVYSVMADGQAVANVYENGCL